MVSTAILLEDVRVTLPSRAGPVAILRGCDLAAEAGEAGGLVDRHRAATTIPCDAGPGGD
jgi:hypothetical protein